MNKRRITYTVLAILLIHVFVLSACNEMPHVHTYSDTWYYDEEHHWHQPTCNDTSEIRSYETHSLDSRGKCHICDYARDNSHDNDANTHEHHWYTVYSMNETHHWQDAICNDADIRNYAEHSFDADGKCTTCGYKNQPHEHRWSTDWSKDYTYHWREPICDDTTEIKDKAKHSFVDNVCSECGYDKIPDPKHLPQTDLCDVGEKFNTVVKPIYDVVETILQDLVENGDVVLDEARNTRIVGIRYVGSSFIIIIRQDIYIYENGEKSEFLQKETGISLENFSESNGETHLAYSNFLRAERKCQSLDNYEEFILPYAEKSAELILAQYEIYKTSAEREIKFHNYGKQLILTADSSLSDTYDKIVANLNSALAERGYPLITNQDLDISFGGNINWEIVNRWILIDVNIGTLQYHFYISFNENGEFSEEYLNYFKGTQRTGYTPSDPDQLNPKNEEYAEFFERLKIEQIDLSNISGSYKYDGEGNALYSPTGGDTFLYF